MQEKKENLIKKIELNNQQIIKDIGLLLQKYYAKGYEKGGKEKTIAVRTTQCQNGHAHKFRINKAGYVVCTRCQEKFYLIAHSEVNRIGIVFM